MQPEFFKQVFLSTVEEQLKKNDPPETRETLERLIKEGFNEGDAKLVIAQCIAAEMVKVVATKTPFNKARFVNCLAQLPKPPEDL
jgi:UDP-glucose 6-dehydrogenase